MTGEMKFYLLAEEAGWDCSSYAFTYSKKLKDSDAYVLLNYNLLECHTHLNQKAKKIIEDFEKLRFETNSVKECFILETTLNHLATHSFPEFYINPLSIDPNYIGDVESIGDLYIEALNQEMTINELIQNETISDEEKKSILSSQVDDYLEDMNMTVKESIDIVEAKAFSKKQVQREKRDMWISLLSCLQFLLLNLSFLFFFLYPFNDFRELLFQPNFSLATTYVVYVYLILLYLNDLFYVAFHIVKGRATESLDYAKRFLKKKSLQVYADIQATSKELYHYLCDAVDQKSVLKDDIQKFTKISSSYIDFKKVAHAPTNRKKNSYVVLQTVCYAFTTLAWIACIVFLFLFVLGLAYHSAV